MSDQAMTAVRGHDRRRTVAALIALFIACGVVAGLTTTVAGQQPQYEVREVNPVMLEDQNLKKMKSAFRSLALARDLSRLSSQDTNYARVYLSTFVPNRITHPDAVPEISELVFGAVDDLRKAQMTSAPAAMEIARSLFLGMKAVAEGNYHPPARVAAILALGQIDVAAGTPTRPPQPVPQVLPILLSLYQDENNDEGIRAAALQGIHRHVRFRRGSIPEQERNAIIDAMMKLLDEPVPATRTSEAHAYLQRFAVDALTFLKPANDKEFASKLVSISTSANRDTLIALYSAARAGQMKEALKGAVETPALVLDQWSARAYRAFEAEVERLKMLDPPKADSSQPPAPRDVLTLSEEATLATAAGGYDEEYEDDSGDMEEEYEDYGDYEEYDESDGGPPPAAPQPPEVIASRRQLNYILQQLQLAATGSPAPGIPETPGGLLAAVEADDRAVVETWIGRMEGVITSINDQLLDKRDKYLTSVELQLAVLQELSGDQLADPQEDEEAPEGDAEEPALPALTDQPAAAAVPAAG